MRTCDLIAPPLKRPSNMIRPLCSMDKKNAPRCQQVPLCRPRLPVQIFSTTLCVVTFPGPLNNFSHERPFFRIGFEFDYSNRPTRSRRGFHICEEGMNYRIGGLRVVSVEVRCYARCCHLVTSSSVQGHNTPKEKQVQFSRNRGKSQLGSDDSTPNPEKVSLGY